MLLFCGCFVRIFGSHNRFPYVWPILLLERLSLRRRRMAIGFPGPDICPWGLVPPCLIGKKPYLVVELVERCRPNLRILLSVAQRALSRRSTCSPTSDNITLDPQPCCNHCLCNPRWCPFHCITRVSLSLDRVSRSFPHSNASFNSLARYVVAILPRSVVAPPMLCHHSTR